MFVHGKMLPVHCHLTGKTQNKILSVCPVINCLDRTYIFCCFIKLRQTFTSIFVFSASSPLLGVYLKERNHVPETAAWPGPGVGPEFYAVMSRGPGPDPQGDLLHLWERGGIKNTTCYLYSAFRMSSVLKTLVVPVVPALSKVKMSPSHLAALLGVLGSELQLERRRVFLRGELVSSAVASNSGNMTM